VILSVEGSLRTDMYFDWNPSVLIPVHPFRLQFFFMEVVSLHVNLSRGGPRGINLDWTGGRFPWCLRGRPSLRLTCWRYSGPTTPPSFKGYCLASRAPYPQLGSVSLDACFLEGFIPFQVFCWPSRFQVIAVATQVSLRPHLLFFFLRELSYRRGVSTP